jgi:hypothetical protein
MFSPVSLKSGFFLLITTVIYKFADTQMFATTVTYTIFKVAIDDGSPRAEYTFTAKPSLADFLQLPGTGVSISSTLLRDVAQSFLSDTVGLVIREKFHTHTLVGES